MKVGLDQYSIHHRDDLTGIQLLDLVREFGLEGIQFGSIHQVSPTLDGGEIGEVAGHARASNLYLEVGIPCPNPHLANPAALRDGNGDLQEGLRRHLEAIAEATVGSRAVRCFVGGPGDRHTRSVPWSQQVADTVGVARDLSPTLRDLDLRLAFENHADATVDELIRVVDDLGPDVAGICLDTGNLPITLDDPLAAATRAAPYTIATHLKDGVVTFADDGLAFNARPCGQGVLPLEDIIRELVRANPDLTLSIEDHDRLFPIPIFRDEYLATFPDLTAIGLAHAVRTAWACSQRIAAGTMPDPVTVEAVPWPERADRRIREGGAYVRGLVSGQPVGV